MLGKRIRNIMIIIAASIGMVVTNAGTAHAGTSTYRYSFEGDPAATWRIEAYGSSAGGFDINAGVARSFNNNAWLTSATSFSAVGMEFTFSSHLVSTCSANIYISSFGVSQVNLEVIDPRTWTGTWYTFTLTSSAYTNVSFPSWSGSNRTKFLRVALIGSNRNYGILIDDLTVSCTTRYP
ncbi:MAG TPA: hypothetical protein VF062_22460 [Candidatus Limnocylindrales bacterium]